MNKSNEMQGAQSPNDPKLSDCAEWQPLCGDMEGGEGGGSTADDTERSSLQRMVRRILDAVRVALHVTRAGVDARGEMRVKNGEKLYRIVVESDRFYVEVGLRGTGVEPVFRVMGGCKSPAILDGPVMELAEIDGNGAPRPCRLLRTYDDAGSWSSVCGEVECLSS